MRKRPCHRHLPHTVALFRCSGRMEGLPCAPPMSLQSTSYQPPPISSQFTLVKDAAGYVAPPALAWNVYRLMCVSPPGGTSAVNCVLLAGITILEMKPNETGP